MGAQCSAVASKEGCRDVLRRPNEVWRLGSGAGAREEEKTRVAWGLCTRLARLPLAVGTCAGPAASAASGARARGVADGSRRALLLAGTRRGRRRRDGHFRAATGTFWGDFFLRLRRLSAPTHLAWVRGDQNRGTLGYEKKGCGTPKSEDSPATRSTLPWPSSSRDSALPYLLSPNPSLGIYREIRLVWVANAGIYRDMIFGILGMPAKKLLRGRSQKRGLVMKNPPKSRRSHQSRRIYIRAVRNAKNMRR